MKKIIEKNKRRKRKMFFTFHSPPPEGCREHVGNQRPVTSRHSEGFTLYLFPKIPNDVTEGIAPQNLEPKYGSRKWTTRLIIHALNREGGASPHILFSFLTRWLSLHTLALTRVRIIPTAFVGNFLFIFTLSPINRGLMLLPTIVQLVTQ
jgi:hypothetical protein